MTGHAMPLYRAPGGKTSPALLKAARECGYEHVGWAQAGFLGDELPSDKFQRPPAGAGAAQHQARRHPAGPPGHLVAPGPLGPAVLEPLVEGLQRKGYCFATLDTHPAYKGWIATHH